MQAQVMAGSQITLIAPHQLLFLPTPKARILLLEICLDAGDAAAASRALQGTILGAECPSLPNRKMHPHPGAAGKMEGACLPSSHGIRLC